jgi:hypothetical protein
MPPRKSNRALGLQRQDPGEELQAGRVDTPTRLDDEQHEVRLVAVRPRVRTCTWTNADVTSSPACQPVTQTFRRFFGQQ